MAEQQGPKEPGSGVFRLENRVEALEHFAFGNGEVGADELLRRHGDWISEARDMRKLVLSTLIVGLLTMILSAFATVVTLGGRAAFASNNQNATSNVTVGQSSPMSLTADDERQANLRGYYTTNQVGRMFRLTDRTIREMCVDGRITPAWKYGNDWRVGLDFTKNDIDAHVPRATGARDVDATRAEAMP